MKYGPIEVTVLTPDSLSLLCLSAAKSEANGTLGLLPIFKRTVPAGEMMYMFPPGYVSPVGRRWTAEEVLGKAKR